MTYYITNKQNRLINKRTVFVFIYILVVRRLNINSKKWSWFIFRNFLYYKHEL